MGPSGAVLALLLLTGCSAPAQRGPEVNAPSTAAQQARPRQAQPRPESPAEPGDPSSDPNAPTAPEARGPVPPVVRIAPEHQTAIDAAVRASLARRDMPGCVVVLGRRDGVVFRRAYGMRALEPSPAPMGVHTLFDLASITKAVVTATSLAMLAEEGAVDLEQPAARYLPAFGQQGKERITLAQLLTHTGGLPAVNPLRDYEDGPVRALERVMALRPTRRARTRLVYSDVGFIVLGEVIASATGQSLDAFARTRIFEPLAMHDTGFRPATGALDRIAPTERADNRGEPGFIHGHVHDPRAHRLGGVAGNAGLFSTADDLARFARMLLGEGALDGVRVLRPETVHTMVTPRHLPGGRRALGWDAAGGQGLSPRAYGHGGYTGTSLAIDPEADLFVLFLSNRVHPDGGGDVRRVVREVRAIAARAVPEASPPPPSGVEVLAGVDVLVRDGFAPLRGARVGLITNDSGRTRDGRSTVDVLVGAPDVQVVALFGPEHGLGADREGRIGEGRDTRTGLPVHSLFGRTRRPSAESLEGIDTLVFDLQDVGARFYTYASTMLAAMEAAAARDLRFVVLDRPNPIGGGAPEGPVVDEDLRSFVNYHALPVRHGMTLGELARLLDAERAVGARLEVIPVEGWRREQRWAETGLPWVPPSPNIRSPDEALLYPALGLLEGTNLSVGRGTPTPFEVLGAPWIEPEPLAAALRRAGIEGVAFESARFTPRSGPYRGRRIPGLRLRVIDPARFRPARAGLGIARALLDLHGGRWDPERLHLAVGDRRVVDALREGAAVEALEPLWAEKLADFGRIRARYLLYR